MSDPQVTADIPAPAWAAESEPFGDSHVHKSKVYAWGTASLHVERLDTPTQEGIAFVVATTPTADFPNGEVIAFEYATVFELWKMLDDLVIDTQTVDVVREYAKRSERLRAASTAPEDDEKAGG
jgi:hypothetical protein